MSATEAQVAASMEALECRRTQYDPCDEGCSECAVPHCSEHFEAWTDRGCPVATKVADAVVAAGPDPAKVAADALREAAAAWPREVNYETFRREIAAPLRQAPTRYTEAEWLLDRADRIEAGDQ